mmetsp:Transcript_34671/g.109491  ORF Transcript_34671/g.109491 Transcript_34671/m.109491 type:complete len:219 (+) Transcript_34671:224-880(+)
MMRPKTAPKRVQVAGKWKELVGAGGRVAPFNPPGASEWSGARGGRDENGAKKRKQDRARPRGKRPLSAPAARALEPQYRGTPPRGAAPAAALPTPGVNPITGDGYEAVSRARAERQAESEAAWGAALRAKQAERQRQDLQDRAAADALVQREKRHLAEDHVARGLRQEHINRDLVGAWHNQVASNGVKQGLLDLEDAWWGREGLSKSQISLGFGRVLQ